MQQNTTKVEQLLRNRGKRKRLMSRREMVRLTEVRDSERERHSDCRVNTQEKVKYGNENLRRRVMRKHMMDHLDCNRYHIENLHQQVRRSISTGDTQNIRENANERCLISDNADETYPTEDCTLQLYARCGRISDGTIDDRWAAPRIGEGTNHGIQWHCVLNEVSLLAKRVIWRWPMTKLDDSMPPSWRETKKTYIILNIWSSCKMTRNYSNLRSVIVLSEVKKPTVVSGRLTAMTLNYSTAHVSTTVRDNNDMFNRARMRECP